ncbi:MAG: helix-turn-helix domain-containing protein [Acutalibacteraceae bacterium]
MSYKHLSRNERRKITLMLLHKVSIREISRKLNRSASTMNREVKRNMQNNQYKADKAHSSYIENRSKCHRKKLYGNT